MAKPAKTANRQGNRAPARARGPAPTHETRNVHSHRLQSLENDPDRLADISWDDESNGYKASLVCLADASAASSAAHPSSIVPVDGDPNHVIRADWDVATNQYKYTVLDINDPRARLP